MLIRDTEKREKVKCIQTDPITSKKLEIISKKDFMVEDISSEDERTESD